METVLTKIGSKDTLKNEPEPSKLKTMVSAIATNESVCDSESACSSRDGVTRSPEESATSSRSRRKAPPRKVVVEEVKDEQESDWLSEETGEPQMGTETQPSPDCVQPCSGSDTPMSADLLHRLSEALSGNVSMQQLINQMISGEISGIPVSQNDPSPLQLPTTKEEGILDASSSGSPISPNISQEMMSAVAQQQLAALTAVSSLNSDPSLKFQSSMMEMAGTSNTRPVLVSKPNKRKLFETSRSASSQSGLRSDPMTRDDRNEIDDLEQFAAMFKKQRIKFGFTQGDVGQALGRRYGTDFSQTTISRFEAMNLSFKNMCKLRPLLKEWLSDAENAIANGASLTDLIDNGIPSSRQDVVESMLKKSELATDFKMEPQATPPSAPAPSQSSSSSGSTGTPLKKRRKRTNLDNHQRQVLDIVFQMNPRPSHEHMAELADQLKLERDVVRVWFCNRRQKMRKVDDVGTSDGNIDPSLIQSMLFAAGQGSASISPKREESDSPDMSVTSREEPPY